MTNQLDIRASPEEVFAVLGDAWGYPHWMVGIQVVKGVDEGFPAVGARFRHRSRRGFRSIDGETEVVAVDEGRSLLLRSVIGPFVEGDIAFELQPIPTGTLLTLHEGPGEDGPVVGGGRRRRWLRVRNAEALWRLRSLAEAKASPEQVQPSVGPASVPRPLGTLSARLFAAIAVVRGARGLHPRGRLMGGTATLYPAGAALARSVTTPVAVRLSRGAGLPHPLPDFNGVAVRFLDAHGTGRHQDLLLTAAPGPPVLRHLIRPSRGFSRSGYSSVLPHVDEGGTLCLFRCDPLPVATLDDAPSSLPLVLHLRVATLLGPWRPAATVTLHESVPEPPDVRFDPWNTSSQLTPTGLLNRLRAPAYAASRAAYPAGFARTP